MWALRRRPWLGALVGLLAVLAVLTPFALIDPTPFFGMPGALASAITIFIAIAAGLLPALVTAVAGGGFFVAYVANAPHPFSGPAAAATAVIWVLVAVIAGFSADQLWRRLTGSFAELRAHELRVRGTLESAAAAVGVFKGPALRCEDANALLRRLFARAQWQDAPLADLLPELPVELLGRLRECAGGRVAALLHDELDLRSDGHTYSLTGHCEGEDERLLFLTLTDVTAAVQGRRQLERLLAVFRNIAVTATPAEVAAELCRAAIGLFASSTASFWSVEGETVRLVARAPGLVAEDRWKLDELADLAEVIRSGVPLFVRDVHEHYQTADGATTHTKLRAYFRERRYSALLGLPVAYGPETGALLFLAWDEAIEQPSDEMMSITRRFADETAIAIERAERLAAQQEAMRLHRRLEASLLPRIGVAGDRVVVEYRYVPGQKQMLIGGDFLDIVELADGLLALIIGDVSGHGPDSAALGAALRASWHALTLQGVGAKELLWRLDQVISAERSDPAEFATACVAWIDAERRRLKLSLAGHPAPLLVGEAGVAEVSAAHGAALGIGAGTDWPLVTVALPEGWDLLFYTDGLLDSFATADGRDRLGLAGLLELIGAIKRPSNVPMAPSRIDGEQLDELLRRVTDLSGRPAQDDVALLLASSRA
jgi:serine phosphatase RsbU (regulator of sigma subunit)